MRPAPAINMRCSGPIALGAGIKLTFRSWANPGTSNGQQGLLQAALTNGGKNAMMHWNGEAFLAARAVEPAPTEITGSDGSVRAAIK